MTNEEREEALAIMNVIIHMIEKQYDNDRVEKAVDTALAALKAEPCEDCRKAEEIMQTLCDYGCEMKIQDAISQVLETECTKCEDAVKRESVLNTLDTMDKALDENRTVEHYKELLAECYKALPTVTPKQRWIPVSERLPKPHELVLLTLRRTSKLYNYIPFISVGYICWGQTTWWCAHEGDCALNGIEVLAWMPIPESYKEGESE